MDSALLFWAIEPACVLLLAIGMYAVRKGFRMAHEDARRSHYGGESETVVGVGMIFIGIGAGVGLIAMVGAMGAS